jgi:hypothetical protein
LLASLVRNIGQFGSITQHPRRQSSLCVSRVHNLSVKCSSDVLSAVITAPSLRSSSVAEYIYRSYTAPSGRGQWWAVVNTVMNLWLLLTAENF